MNTDPIKQEEIISTIWLSKFDVPLLKVRLNRCNKFNQDMVIRNINYHEIKDSYISEPGKYHKIDS